MSRRVKQSTKQASDKCRKYRDTVGEPFNRAELIEYIIDPLAECYTVGDFMELAYWAASESPQLLRALYTACRTQDLSEYSNHLEVRYGCGTS